MTAHVVDLAQPVRHAALVLGIAGGSFFLIGGAAMAIAAMVVAAVPGVVLALEG